MLHRKTKFQPPLARGFTLLELLIVVGILVLVVGLALPALLKAKKTAFVSRQQADLHTIELALEAYKNDFGDYPRFIDPSVQAAETTSPNQQWLDWSTDRGARLLCFALLAPGPAGTGTTANPGEDGADGPGFRARRSASGGAYGKVYGPYLDSAKFRLEFDTTGIFPNKSDAKLLDGNGNPILYFPGLPGPANVTSPNYYAYGVTAYSPSSTTLHQWSATSPITPFYNAADNTADPTPSAAVNGVPRPLLDPGQMAYILGDRDSSGNINGTETPVTTQPYLLWTAGADGQYGFGINSATGVAWQPSDTGFSSQKTDDVCNFDIPPDLRK